MSTNKTSVNVIINGTVTTLTEGEGGVWSGTLTAPNVTSYNAHEDMHCYPVTVVATNHVGTSTSINPFNANADLRDDLWLRVYETTAPTIQVTGVTEGAYITTATPPINILLLDEANGSGVDPVSFILTFDKGKPNEFTMYNHTAGVTMQSASEYFGDSSYNGYYVTIDLSKFGSSGHPLGDGEHTIEVEVCDNDDNLAETDPIAFTVDTTAPNLVVTNPAENGTYTAEPNLTISGTVSDDGGTTPTITITLNGTDVGNVTTSNGAFSKSVILTNGMNTIVITATDLSGKTTTITRTIGLDSSAPVIASVVITPNAVNVGELYTVKVTVQ